MAVMRRRLAVIFIASLAFPPGIEGQQTAMGCGGFVRSKKNIDFSRIEVELQAETPSGGWRKVGQTDCAPNNGYYFLPVEELGTYMLKAIPPRGWKLSPDHIKLDINGKTDPCSKNRDLDFTFIGFGITGSVRSKGSGSRTGPSGITIELLSFEDKEKVIQFSETDGNGHYLFFGVIPGKYILRVGEIAQNTYTFDRVSLEVDVGDDVGASDPFYIDGYSLTGLISTHFGLKLENVQFNLLQKDGRKIVQSTKSDENGRFKFSNVAIGSYLVTFDSEAEESANLELAESEMPVSVGHEHVQMPSFVVKSFSVAGQVLSSEDSKLPLSGVVVKGTGENGESFEATTNENGKFKFFGVTSGGTLVARAFIDGYVFESVSLTAPSPQSQLKIVPTRYRLSGTVDMSSIPSIFEIKVQFASKNEPSNVERVVVSEEGTFSSYFPVGTYVVSVELKSEHKGIGFAPVQQVFSVVDKPIEAINFQPVKADIRGRVRLLRDLKEEEQPLEVSLSMQEESNFGLKKRAVDTDGRFEFLDVLPGNYIVSVSESGNRCWSKPVQELIVSEDVDDIVFQQLGYYIEVESLHPTLLLLKNDKLESQQKEVVIEAGTNTICVESSGHVDEKVSFSTKGCERFRVSPPSFTSSLGLHAQKVFLKPTHFKVSGRILSKASVPQLGLQVESELRHETLQVTRDDGGYFFSLDGLPGEELTFVPQSDEYLFDPEIIHVFVDHSCHLEAVRFEAVSGFFIRGQIDPPVVEVEVKLLNLPPGLGNLKYATSLTDGDGNYRLGPLPKEIEDSQYKIEMKKEGYVFEKVEERPGYFRSKKLASISVEVINDDGKSINGAVISVSGGTAYRSNTHTGPKGLANFISLSPGEYFVKPQLKEFEFSPKHKLMNVKEGETSSLRFSGKRVSFSAYGKVVSLNGEPEAGITLRAKGIKPDGCVGTSEDATSESKGEFRFRGLVPKCQYSIGLRDEGMSKGDVERLIPKESFVLMEEKDMKLPSSIVVMRSVQIMDVTLRVDDGNDPDSEAEIKVVMTDHQEYSYSVKRVVGQLVTFPAIPKDSLKSYSILVETLPDKFSPKRKAAVEFLADEHYKFVNVTLKKSPPTSDGGSGGDPKRPSALKILLFTTFVFMCLVGYFARDRVHPWFNYLQELINSQRNAVKSSQASGDDAKGDVALGLVAATSVRKRSKKRLT